LSVFEIIQDGDKKEECEKEHKDIMPEEAGEVNHIRRKRKKKSDQKGLFFIDVSNAVDTIYEGDEQKPKECWKDPGDEI
jgi:hypothetical protein